MATVQLSSPWVIFYREVDAMFKYDPLVHVVYDEAANHLKIYVDEAEKAAALDMILPTDKEFGNVTMKISVIPPNDSRNEDFTFDDPGELFEAAFDTNGAFAFTKVVFDIFSDTVTYVVFRKKVVQYFTDNLGDYYGLCSTLYQTIARDIFIPERNVYYCTDIEDPVTETNSPLGEWP